MAGDFHGQVGNNVPRLHNRDRAISRPPWIGDRSHGWPALEFPLTTQDEEDLGNDLPVPSDRIGPDHPRMSHDASQPPGEPSREFAKTRSLITS
jgi:hypothetical protein